MKPTHLAIAAAAATLAAGAAYAQQPQPAAATPPAAESSTAVPSSGTASTDVTAPASTDVTAPASAASAGSYAQSASYTATTLTNGPIPDTPENRRKYGQPLSHAGKRTAAKGN